MKLHVHLDLSPLDALAKRLKTVPAKVKPKALKAMANVLLQATDEAFTNPSSRQAPWPALKPATLARKKPGSGPLVDSGILKNSLRRYIDPATLAIGISTPAKYALTHQLGRDNIPARPFIPITRNGDIAPANVREEVQAELESALLDALKNAAP